MEAYQPLNRYGYCQTKGVRVQPKRQVNKTSNTQLTKSMVYKLALSMIVVLFVVASSVFFKIDASEPISFVPEANEIAIVVGSGDTLWQLASNHYSDQIDVGYAIYLIKDRNGLSESVIYPGQTLILPELK